MAVLQRRMKFPPLEHMAHACRIIRLCPNQNLRSVAAAIRSVVLRT